MRLKDKVALITGGSRGIGFATADRFLQEGAVVILTASSQGSADRAVAQLKEKHPSGTVARTCPAWSRSGRRFKRLPRSMDASIFW